MARIPAPLRTTVGPGSPGVGAISMQCKILSVDPSTNIANVIDQVGNQRQISTTRVFGKNSLPPQAGDNWLITQQFGAWMFAAYINISGSAIVGIQNYTTTTGARPDPTLIGLGVQIYDSTLHKPIWSDGTVWRDAMGNTV